MNKVTDTHINIIIGLVIWVGVMMALAVTAETLKLWGLL
jgi:hypothetical protein